MTEQELKELLKEAFEAGRQYQRRVHLYSGMYSDDPDSYFTKWYDKENNYNVRLQPDDNRNKVRL